MYSIDGKVQNSAAGFAKYSMTIHAEVYGPSTQFHLWFLLFLDPFCILLQATLQACPLDIHVPTRHRWNHKDGGGETLHPPHTQHSVDACSLPKVFALMSSFISKLCSWNHLSLKTVPLHCLHQELCVAACSLLNLNAVLNNKHSATLPSSP